MGLRRLELPGNNTIKTLYLFVYTFSSWTWTCPSSFYYNHNDGVRYLAAIYGDGVLRLGDEWPDDDDHLCKEVIFRLLNGQYIWARLIKWYYILSMVRLGTITDEHSFEVKQKVVNGNS